ncbi:DUF2029 domain-containing protein [Maribellus sp. CM-23]|uniref:glycosyltransferase 87 family protein n=1 Tax=Maribellus sp. CM-23 TaxID=2781026 RepID=UPI001F2D98C1|nr:glycosyltransferase 87 family protein [Maribellus sp. CM-23]MCE4563070.1 DUF2029 domain-containing protein [Maribellus sp. CM-23]
MLFPDKTGKIISQLFASRRFIFWVGFVLVLLVTTAKVMDERYKVFLVYKFGTLDFWNNIDPYANWQHPLDQYIYGPVFSVFFSVFAFLPSWLGAVLWNAFNYSLFFLAVFALPAPQFDFKKKRFVFWFLFPIALTDLVYFQSNLLVASLFMLVYSMLERNQFMYGILLLSFSGFSKIYGLIQLATLLFYKRFTRNAVVAVLLLAGLFFVPLIKIPGSQLLSYYQSWFTAIGERHNPLDFEVIYRLLYLLGYKSAVDHVAYIQGISLLFICAGTLLNYKRYHEVTFRTQVLGILLGWVILFSTTAEKHTYVIAMAGLVLWYLSGPKPVFDKILLWLNFFLIILVPIDAIFPKALMRFLYYTLGLNLVLFLLTWIRMFSFTFGARVFSLKSK